MDAGGLIVETLIAGSTLIGFAICWAVVQKHRITAEMQKHKLNHDLEVLKPTPEPKPEPTPPSPAQQSLTALLERRENLERHINDIRKRVADYTEARFAQYRADSLQALEDARQEQQELVLEQTGLLEMMHQVRIAPLDEHKCEHELAQELTEDSNEEMERMKR